MPLPQVISRRRGIKEKEEKETRPQFYPIPLRGGNNLTSVVKRRKGEKRTKKKKKKKGGRKGGRTLHFVVL